MKLLCSLSHLYLSPAALPALVLVALRAPHGILSGFAVGSAGNLRVARGFGGVLSTTTTEGFVLGGGPYRVHVVAIDGT